MPIKGRTAEDYGGGLCCASVRNPDAQQEQSGDIHCGQCHLLDSVGSSDTYLSSSTCLKKDLCLYVIHGLYIHI